MYEDVVSEVDNVKDAVARPVHVSDLKHGSIAVGSEANELKRDKAAHACDHMISADMFLRKSCCSDSESELSNSAKSSVPIVDVVSKRVATSAVSTGSAVKSKLKPNPRVMNVVSNSECSGYDSSVVDRCSVVKGDKLKRLK